MDRILKTRNRIIIFELLLLIVMLALSFKIYLLEEGLVKLSNEKTVTLTSIYNLDKEIKDSVFLSVNYITTGNSLYKAKYFLVLKNSYSTDKKITTKNLFNKIISQAFLCRKAKLLVHKIFSDFNELLKKENEFIHLFDNHQKDAAKKLINSKEFKILQLNLTENINAMIAKVNKRINMLFKIQKKEVYTYFILLAIIGTIFVFINIYFFIYLANIAMQQLREKNKLIEEVEHFNDTLEDEVENRTKEIKKLMKVKSEFLANMSHEIRTPLNAMFGFVRILQEKDFDKESQKYLAIIEKSGKNLLAIINDILDFSKIEAGKLNIEKVEFDPKEEIEIIYSLFESLASEKNITLKVNDNLKYNIITDPVRLKQVISNLLSNAIKFSNPKSKVILNIDYNKDTQQLYVEVVDEGIGIPKDKLNHIFDAFSQADSSTTRKYGGTGLGLSISSRLIELLGGELQVESEEGKGATFYFYIPAQRTSLITTKKAEMKKSILDNIFNIKLLLVEDNKANQMFMSVVLKKMGIKFDIANDGLEAIEKFQDGRYDLILMDENMPNMNGMEATKRIRQIEKENKLNSIPIVALTANAMEGDREKFIQAGMDFYLSKPLDIEKFKLVLSQI